MNRLIIPRTAALFASLALTSALAQVAPAYLGSTGPFLNSALCTRVARCTPAGTVKLDGLQGTVNRLFYTVKLRKAQSYGRPSYTIYIDRAANTQKIGRAALMYPAAQDSVEDGTFFKAFVTAMTGYDVSKAPKNVFMCDLRIRGKSTNYDVSINNVNAGYASEAIVAVNDMGREGDQMFSDVSASTKIVVAENCH